MAAKHRQKLTPAPAPKLSRRPSKGWLFFGGIVIAAVLGVLLKLGFSPSRLGRSLALPSAAAVARLLEPEKKVFAEYAGSESCRACHRKAYDDWAKSNHGLAERPPSLAMDKVAFDPPCIFRHGTQSTETYLQGGQFEIKTLGYSNVIAPYTVDRVIGNHPLRQFLTPRPGGRWQTMEASYDPITNQWFNSYGNEDRMPGEWGHWTGRGMNWNTMCAGCHNTRLRKNYDPVTDTFHTTMAEMSVGCEACHGPMKDHVEWRRKFPNARRFAQDPTLHPLSNAQMRGTCGSCHARRYEVTGDFKPGDSFFDHYSLTIVDLTDTYHADGQVRDEDYAFASLLSSRMRMADVRCLDCHDPHTMKRLVAGNNLCLRCHSGSNPNAPLIDPVKHSFHSPTNSGFTCTGCHMPTTTYMQVHHRRDHGFTIPDPLLTKQFGIPNACSRCHADKSTEWSLEYVEKWYGARMQRHTRERAQWIAKARLGDDAARDPVVGLLETETNGFWRAVAANCLDRWIAEPTVTAALLARLKDDHPMVREKVIRALDPLVQAQRAGVAAAMQPLLDDPVRSVRVAAAWALRASVDTNSLAGRELAHAMAINSDQPAGRLQNGVFCLARSQLPEAIVQLRTAVGWDPNSAALRHELSVMLSMADRAQEALEQMKLAVQLEPKQAEFRYKLGLALAETGDLTNTVTSLQEAVKLEPKHARAWYNLGLAQNSLGNLEAALASLAQAAAADPSDPRAPYARATILAQAGRTAEARTAASRALAIEPRFTAAAQLLESLR